MTHDDTPTLLRHLDTMDPGTPPVGHLLTAGRAAKRRQRRAVIAGTAAATTLIVGGGAVATQVINSGADTNRQDITAAQGLDVPPGTRLVGLGRVAIAVPDEWAANAASCNTPIRNTYYFPHPQDCQIAARPGVSSVAISTAENAPNMPRVPDIQRDGTVDGYDVLSSGLICTSRQSASCLEAFGIPDLDAWFTVRVPRSDDATDTTEAIRDSLRVLPNDYTTIPFVPYGTEEQVTAAMREAGLAAEVEYAECPANANCVSGVTGVEPAIGTAMRDGSTVTLTVLTNQTGPEADDTLVGPRRDLSIGEAGPMTLWLHCGLEYIMVGDKVWRTDPRGDAGPPIGWPEQLTGTATRTGQDTITFTSDHIDEQVVFYPYKPETPGDEPNTLPDEAVCY
jgi:hypothetical protein